jgi:hypothetical protein
MSQTVRLEFCDWENAYFLNRACRAFAEENLIATMRFYISGLVKKGKAETENRIALPSPSRLGFSLHAQDQDHLHTGPSDGIE